MPLIELELEIRATAEVVFDLCRSIELHIDSSTGTNEEAVAGKRSGLLELGEEVTWRATHLGVRQRLTSRMVHVDRPSSFRDIQVRGAFKRFEHEHRFIPTPAGVLVRSLFEYESPWGWLGRVADRLIVERHMRRYLGERLEIIRRVAEGGDVERYLA